MKLRFKFLILTSFLIFFISILNPLIVTADENEAISAINKAEDTLAITFKSIKEAETNGADISGLHELLNDATELLAQADNYLQVEDFEKAENFANLAWQIGNNLKNMALSLEEIKSDEPAKEMWNITITSIIEVVVITIVSLLSWTVFKKLYVRKIYLKKPQVATFEP